MGIFSDICENSDCQARVKKGADFCSKCGWAGANSLTSCPDCHKRVGRTSQFCWSCGGDISEAGPPRIVGDRWVRDEQEYAVRVYPDDLDRKLLSKKIRVDAGTVAVIERNGRIKKDVEWGSVTLESLFKLFPPTSVILVCANDAVLRPTFRGLKDANGADLELTVQIVLGASDYEAFFGRYFEGNKRRVTLKSLEESLSVEMQDLARDLVRDEAIEAMFGNARWRDAFEDGLRGKLSDSLKRYGMELRQVNFVDFGGDHFEKLQQDRGETYMGNHAADHLAEKVAIRQRVYELKAHHRLETTRKERDLAVEIRETNNKARIRAVLSDQEREETVRQALHELDLKDRLRQAENEELERELEKTNVDHQNDIALGVLVGKNRRLTTEEEFERARATARLDFGREQKLKDSEAKLLLEENEIKLKKMYRSDAYEGEDFEDYRERKRMARTQEDSEHRAKMLRDIQQGELDAMEKLRRLDLEEKGMDIGLKKYEKDAEIAVAQSDDKLKAAVADTRTEQLEERLREQRDATERARDDSDRRAGDVKDLASSFAGALKGNAGFRAGTGGGLLGGADQEAACPHCNKPVPVSFPNCPWCRKKLTE